MTFERVDLSGQVLDEPFRVPWAPAELTWSKSATYAEIGIPGLEQPLLQFVRGEAENLSLELFLDADPDAAAVAGTGASSLPFAEQVEWFHKLVAVRGDLHAPPLVRVSWGRDFPGSALGVSDTPQGRFTAVVLSVQRRFSLFSPDGAPLRAVVTLQLKQYATVESQIKAINYQSADHTRVHVLADGETLPLVAHDAYGNPGLWRVVADHNRLSEVRDPVPGTRLELPPLEPR